MITVIHSIPMNNLEAALDRAVNIDPGLALARATLLFPLRLLGALGRDADAALRDDGHALERMRLLLAQAAIAVPGMVGVLEHENANNFALAKWDAEPHNELADPSADEVPGKRRRKLCPCGLIDLSGLVIVGLASARVGARTSGSNIASGFVATVEALGIAALLGESLSQAIADDLRDDQLVALLGGVRSHATAQLASLAPLILDNVERARYAAIRQLFVDVHAAVDVRWDSTFDRSIIAVERIDADHIKVRLDVDGDNDQTNALLMRFEGPKATAKFVFWTSDDEIVEVAATRIWKPDDFAELPLPANARLGWLGIATDEDKQAARKDRLALRKRWRKLDNEPPLRANSIPVELILVPATGKAIAPPRSAVACWAISVTELQLEQAGQVELRDGEPARLHVRVDRSPDAARLVLVRGEGESLEQPVGEERTSFTIPGAWVSQGAELQLRLFVGGSQVPDDQRTIRISTKVEPVSYPIVVIPLEFVLDKITRQVPAERVTALLGKAKQLHPELVVLPTPPLPTEDRQIAGDPGDLSDAALEQLLARLARVAGQAEGLERVQVIGLIPGAQPVSRRVTAEAAARVGVATEAGALELLRPLEQAPTIRPKRKRLRLIGRVDKLGVELLEPMRVNERAAAVGGPIETNYDVVVLGSEERELARYPITTHSRSGDFVALLELPDAAVRIELGPRGQVMRRKSLSPIAPLFGSGLNIGALLSTRTSEATVRAPTWSAFERPPGTLGLELREAKLPEIAWRYEQSHGVRGSIELELDLDGFWWRIARLPSSRSSFELSPALLERARRVRVVASDGWASVSKVIELQDRMGGPS